MRIQSARLDADMKDDAARSLCEAASQKPPFNNRFTISSIGLTRTADVIGSALHRR